MALIAGLCSMAPGAAQELSPEEEAARKAADPLGDVRALMTDNTIAFGGGKTIVLKSGDFTDLSIGAYPLVARPDRAAEWQLKLGFSYFFN